MTQRILVVEDEKLLRWSLRQQLERWGHVVLEAENGAQARSQVAAAPPDLVLLDIRLPDADGLDLLVAFHREDPQLPVIVMTGHGTVETAIEAMRRGAVNYIDKPFGMDELQIKIEMALEQSSLGRELRYLRSQSAAALGSDRIIAASKAMKEVLSRVRKVARSPSTTVLLQGESGTGKDVIARALHSGSDRTEKPFMNITCSAMPDQLLESELYGHEKGAFTDAASQKKGLLELSQGGTVFLDELGETSLAFQAKLLRFLEEKSFKRVGGTSDIRVDVRVVAATNRNLEEMVRTGKFREDLFYRLNITPIFIPPLRERVEDILPLVTAFIEQFNREFKRRVKGISAEARRALEAARWPGNVRELRNVIERAMIFCEDNELQLESLGLTPPVRAGSTSGGSPGVHLPPAGLDFENDVEKAYVIEALRQAGGNQGKAAKLLNMNRDQIRYRIKKFGLRDTEGEG